jgi:formylglycine-generating enzyme required for sulfatase activity
MKIQAALQSSILAAFLSGCAPAPSGETINMEFVKIEPGTFLMGCPPGNIGCDGDERPPHEVKITKAFEIGKYEVTQTQWKIVMGTEPSYFKGENLPVEQVSWDDANRFMARMNERNDGHRYRLPTEAEWEYAARAGNAAMHHGTPNDIAWFMENSDGVTHAVGTKAPNAWGLHDTQGNVYEFVQDWFGPYPNDLATDPTGPVDGSERVPRGGSWMSTSRGIRLPNRNLIEPGDANFNIGFRCVRESI